MQDSQSQKFDKFSALHQQQAAFVIPNPWDAGTARILTRMGFAALATTSAGYAFSVGKRDSFSALGRAEILANAKAIVEATNLPVSGDLEDGFGGSPEECVQTIQEAIKIGLIGGSIEDATGNPEAPIMPIDLAAERIQAAAQAATNAPFLLTGRAENFLWGRPDLSDTIDRLQAYSEAGADVLFAPGLPGLEAIKTVCKEVDKPLNVVMGLQGTNYSVQELSDAGVKRISVGGSFARAAMGAMMRAASEVMEQGTFSYSKDAVPDRTISQMMSDSSLEDRT